MVTLAMTPRTVAAVVCGLLLSITPRMAAATPDEFLDQYLWRSRVLIAFAPSADDPALERQRRTLADAGEAAADERDLMLVEVTGDVVRTPNGGESVRPSAAAALRRRFAAPADRFMAVLVGKDGGTKLVSVEPIPADRLFATIDAMPMRRREASDPGQRSPK